MSEAVDRTTYHKKMTGNHRPILLLVFLYILSCSPFFSGMPVMHDSFKWAAAARNIALGRGLAMQDAYPLEFAQVPEGAEIGLNQIRQQTTTEWVHPLFVAAAFKIFGVNEFAFRLTTLIFMILVVLLTYKVANELFGHKPALLSAAIFACSDVAISYGVSGLTEPLLMALILMSIWLLLRHKSYWAIAGAALCIALVPHTKVIGKYYAALLLLFGIFSLGKKGVLKSVALIGIAIILIWVGDFIGSELNPKMINSQPSVQTQSKQPPQASSIMKMTARFLEKIAAPTLMLHSPIYPGHSYPRGLEVIGNQTFFLAHPRAYLEKVELNAKLTFETLFSTMFNPVVLAFFWVGLFLLPIDRKIRMVVILTLGFLTIQTAVGLLLFRMDRYFHPFSPLIAVFAGATLWSLTLKDSGSTHIRRWTLQIMGLIAILACLFPFSFFAGYLNPSYLKTPLMDGLVSDFDKDWKAAGRFISGKIGSSEVVVTNEPSTVAWYSDRFCIWIPNDIETLTALSKKVKIGAVVFVAGPGLLEDQWRNWLMSFAKSPTNNGWSLSPRDVMVGRPDGLSVYVFRKTLNQSEPFSL